MADRTLRGADGLRTLACLMVVFHHLSQQLVLFNPGIDAPAPLKALAEFFTSSGSAGVSVFFVLSGFLLALPFWNAYFSGEALPDLRVYAARRAGRIMPGFYLNLFVFALFSLLFQPEVPAQLLRYFAGLTFTSGFHWLTFFPVEGNGPLWSIGFEVVSYVLLPLGMVGLFALPASTRSFRVGLGWWVGLWLVVLGANAWIQQAVVVEDIGKGWQYGLLGGAKFWMPRYNPVGFFGHFSLGILAAGVALQWSRSAWNQKKPWLFDGASLVLFVLWLSLLIGRTNQDQFSWNWQDQPYYFPAFPGLTALLLACLTQSRWMGSVFDNPFTRYTARISFGLYLWHTFVLGLFNGSITDTAEWLVLVATTLVLSYAVATLSWRVLEEPILRRVQKWRPRQSGEPRRRVGRFGTFVVSAAAVLVMVPLLVALTVRPSAWTIPGLSEPVFSSNQPGPLAGLASGGAGTFYSTKNGSEVHRLGADKTDLRLYALPEPGSEVRLSFSRPAWEPWKAPTASLSAYGSPKPWLWNLKVGPDNRLYVAATTEVLILSPEGTVEGHLSVPFRGDFGVMDVAFGPGDELYVSAGDQIVVVDPATGKQTVAVDGKATGFGQAAGLFFDHTKTRLFVCAYERLKPAESRILEYHVGGPGALVLASSTPAEGALFGAEAPSGRRFFTSAGGRLVGELVQGKVEWTSTPNLGPLLALAFAPGIEDRVYAATWDGTVGQILVGGTRHD